LSLEFSHYMDSQWETGYYSCTIHTIKLLVRKHSVLREKLANFRLC